MYDCISLAGIWDKATNDFMFSKLKLGAKIAKCKLNSCITIGSHFMKVIKSMNNSSTHYKRLAEVLKYDPTDAEDRPIKYIEEQYTGKGPNKKKVEIEHLLSEKKHLFVKSFKRGGINHCNKRGSYTEPVCCYDVTSMYPSSRQINLA